MQHRLEWVCSHAKESQRLSESPEAEKRQRIFSLEPSDPSGLDGTLISDL
jgi:hypothetical protein